MNDKRARNALAGQIGGAVLGAARAVEHHALAAAWLDRARQGPQAGDADGRRHVDLHRRVAEGQSRGGAIEVDASTKEKLLLSLFLLPFLDGFLMYLKKKMSFNYFILIFKSTPLKREDRCKAQRS